MNQIRNFCIIAHIDHGKSTLSDRLMEITGTVTKREMKEQLLDQLDIERERGITIKLAPVRMKYRDHILNLIDTPGHVDFAYEVSRSLAAVEGAILLVDATQGVQAQTINNLNFALEHNLAIIPVINKIDLPNADIERAEDELTRLTGLPKEQILRVSGKTGEGVKDLLDAIIDRIPPTTTAVRMAPNALRALIFDSFYDEYRGVIAYIRVVDGSIKAGHKIRFMGTFADAEVLEVGTFSPKLVPAGELTAGEIGYVVTGLRELKKVRVGDTVASGANDAVTVEALPGYKEITPMVFAGIFPKMGDEFGKLREAMDKLSLNDAAFSFEPERATALGFGFRCGFLGLLHLEIMEERLRREYDIEVVTTVPSVGFHVLTTKGEELHVRGAHELPDQNYLEMAEEPWVKAQVISPKDFIGPIMQLMQDKRGVFLNTEFLGGSTNGHERMILHYELPLAAILTDFYDRLKSVSSGYASLSYDVIGYRSAEVVRLDIHIAEEDVPALATIVYRDEAEDVGRKIVSSLKDTLPRQQFAVKVQALIGGKIVASDRVAPFRKDVTGYLSGGDASRKQKLLEKQKKGKKKMMERGKGKIDIPTEAYLAVLKR